eukprot:13304340-Heterocapsa_arctica.AAC.1
MAVAFAHVEFCLVPLLHHYPVVAMRDRVEHRLLDRLRQQCAWGLRGFQDTVVLDPSALRDALDR